VTNTPYLKQIGIVIDGTGTYRSDSCQNVEVIGGRCRFCRNKKRNLRNKHWMELMKPPQEPAEEVDTDELLSKSKKAYPKEVTDKKSGSNKGPVKVSPEQEELFESNSSGKANKKRKTNQTTTADDPVSNRCDDISMQGNEAGGEAGKELTMDTVQLM